MIYIKKGQPLKDNPGMVMYDQSGYYDDGTAVICAMAYAPDEPVCRYEAKFVAYGGMVYSISDPDDLMKEILKIDPKTLFGKDSTQVAVDNLVDTIVPQQSPDVNTQQQTDNATTTESVINNTDNSTTTPETNNINNNNNNNATSTDITNNGNNLDISTTTPNVDLSTTTPGVDLSTSTPGVDLSTTTSAVDLSTTTPDSDLSTTTGNNVDLSTTTPTTDFTTTTEDVGGNIDIVPPVDNDVSTTTDSVVDTINQIIDQTDSGSNTASASSTGE